MMMKQTFFISHGSPTLSIDETLPARHFLQSWKETIFPTIPTSILVISAHWETSVPTLNFLNNRPNDTIYDFYGFPQSMYELKYPAPGAPELAKRVKDLLLSSGSTKQVNEDTKRGLDHGAWVPLMLMYPEAQIPVCQLSVQPHKDAAYHYNIGKALAPLKDEGVLIIGSGSATHNLRHLKPQDGVVPWAMEFDTWLKEALLNGRYEDVIKYEEKAPHAKMAHPRPEHFYPLHVAMGAAGVDAKAKLIHHSWSLGSLSYASYQFTSAPTS
ncbi:hypothetical protein F8388_020918 [Cannabis sativa]|uniref:Extradiol ring-cleavage dioxygenase class III enzyme subunit B domain-containing protein n=1 Tax=Cannabis sativa TaxID=3483 RepID=A0A7J6FKG0_CANSA|nr:hypothetical protein F8388_020918 [Cannabis sativa]